MFEYIKNLQKKPTHHRKRITFLTSALISGLIFFAWAATFSARLNLNNDSDQGRAETASAISPVSSLKGSFDGVLKDFKRGLDQLK